MTKADDDFRIDGYKFLPRSMIPEFKALQREPMWGDPTYRVIPRNVGADEIAVAHLHLNPDDVMSDFNIALPLKVFAQFEEEGRIGSLAGSHYSFMGYQGRSSTAWRDVYGPELVTRLRQEDVDLLILAPG